MNPDDRMSLASGVAVLLAATALVPLFDSYAWVLRAVLAVAVVLATGALTRRAGLPLGLRPLVGLLALLAYAVVVFAGSTLHALVLPGSETLAALRSLLQSAGTDIQEYGPPVPPHEGLVLLVVLGLGAVALLVETAAVLARRAAVGGLPLLALFAVPSAVLTGGLGWLPFALGAAGWLGLMLLEGSDEVGRWGTALRAGRSDSGPAGLGRAGRRIGGAALGVAVLVPALLPGLDARLLDGGRGGGTGGEGTHSVTTYNPITRLRGELTLPEAQNVLSYTTSDAEPDYLRMTTLGVYDGNGWRQDVLNGNLRDNGVGRPLPVPLATDSGIPVRPVQDSIKIISLSAAWLPAPATPTQVQVEGPWMWDAASASLFATRADSGNVQSYDVRALRVLPEREQLEQGGDQVPADIAPYTAAIEATPYVRALTARLVAGKRTNYDRAAALQAFFRSSDSGFAYREQTRSGGSPDALQDFLQQREGFCEQYASAMAAMLRLAGVPSRVAVGFTPGRKQSDGSYLVTTDQAHAWPEAWFPNAGWVRFEPTPSQDGITPPVYDSADSAAAAGATGNDQAKTPATASADATRETAIQRKERLQAEAAARTPETPAPAPAPVADSGNRLVLPALAVAALLLLLLAPAAVHALRRRRRWRQADASTAWDQVRDDALDAGHDWRDADSPRQAAHRLRSARTLPPAATEALLRLAQQVERHRYARPGSEEFADHLAADASGVRRGLHATLPLLGRLRMQLLPASTLRWAHRGVVDAVAAVQDRTDALSRDLQRRLRRRPARAAG